MVFEKLSAIQRDLFVPKERPNDFGKYKYRSCEDILANVKPLCEKNKTVLILDASLESLEGDIFIKATATLRDLEDGSAVSANGYARHEKEKKGMDASQISGSATSYARKYALAGLFGIDNEKDSDATNDTPKDSQKTEPKPTEKKADEVKVQKVHVNTLKSEIRRRGLTEDVILQSYKLKTFEGMTMAQFESAMNGLKRYKVQDEC